MLQKGNVWQTQLDTLKSKIPFLSETLPASYDTWGNERKRQDSTVSAAIANFINPGTLGYDARTPLDSEITRLFDATQDNAVFPYKAEWSVNDAEGNKINLTNEQYSEYQKTMGQTSYDIADALINSDFYNGLDDSDKAKYLSDIYSVAKGKAKQIDSFDYDKCYKRLHQFLKNIKDQNPDFKYIFVPEFHKSGRIHFHGIGINCDKLKLEDSGIKKNGKKIYNVNSKTFRYGFTTVSKIEDTQKVSSYITKYITKEMITATKGKHRYLCSRNLDTAEVENIMLDDVENFMKSVELNPKVYNQKKYTNEETGQEITYIKVKK